MNELLSFDTILDLRISGTQATFGKSGEIQFWV